VSFRLATHPERETIAHVLNTNLMAPALGIKGLQARITNHFEEKGFNGNQIAKAILVHEILGICLLGNNFFTAKLSIRMQ
jgi:hypothetical protein